MKLTRNALALGFAVAAISAAACSSQHGSTGGSSSGGAVGALTEGQGNTGSVGMHLNIGTSGATISSLSWTISNGANTYNGTINMTDDAGNAAQSIEFVAGPVVAGPNYTVTLQGSDSNGDPCTGTSPAFTVTAGTSVTAQAAVNVVCTVPADASTSTTVDSGSVAVDAGVTLVNQSPWNCPGITGVSISPAELHPPEIGTISGGVAGGAGGTQTLVWSATCGTGTPIIGNPNSPTTTFSCGSALNTDCTLTLTVGLLGTGADGGSVGQVCSAAIANTTISETIHCETGGITLQPCPTGQTQCGTSTTDCENLQNGSGPNGSCGTCGATACSGATPTCQAGVCVAPPPKPCTGTGDAANCVKCDGNASGICTPTEQVFVNQDIAKNNLAGGQESGSNGCYECLWNAGCLDDTVNVDTGKECGDLSGTVGAGAQSAETKTQACLNTLNCILPSDCQNAKAQNGASATDGIDNCYCGSSFLTASACNNFAGAPATPAPNGSCASTELDGLGDTTASTGSTVLTPFTNRGNGSGMANAIFLCAGANSASFSCPTCF